MNESLSLKNDILANEVEQTEITNSYYNNGQKKETNTSTSKYRSSTPSAMSVAQGHTDAREQFTIEEETTKFDRKGNIKESRVDYDFSANSGVEIHTDLYSKGDTNEPSEITEARLIKDCNDKILRIYQNQKSKSSTYNALISDENETFSLEKNKKSYDVVVDSKGDINATEYTKQKDGNNMEKKLDELASQILLNKMHRKADNAIKKLTENEYKNTKEYIGSLSNEKSNTPMLGDVFEAKPDNYAEIQEQVKESSENTFNEKSAVSANDLLQTVLLKSGRPLKGVSVPNATQTQTNTNTNTNANILLTQVDKTR